MEKIKLEDLIRSTLGNKAQPASAKEIIELSTQNIKSLNAMVFLPSGDGYLIPKGGDEK